MTEVGILEARANFARLVREASEGRSVTITKRGKPVAQLVPYRKRDRAAIAKAVADLKAFAAEHTLDGLDWRELRDEGRK